jgi:Ca2+-binding EF-hand superfamily protein
MKKKSIFDDQHQPMSDWLDKLANDESANVTDFKDEDIPEKSRVKYAGISSTWSKRQFVEPPKLNDSTRVIENRPRKSSIEQIEKEARRLLQIGVSLEKIASILKRRVAKEDLKTFNMTTLESEFGKLGHIYLDASLVDDCNDLSLISKNATVAFKSLLQNVKKIAKCETCLCNKKGHCSKLDLNITDDLTIKTAEQAKNILNKFASMKYVNSYFVKATDLTKYYNKLANENPDKVVSEFLSDISSRRASQKESLRLDAKNINSTFENNVHHIKYGKNDNEISIAFKQALLQNPSIRAAKSELSKKYGHERVTTYFNEARTDIKKYAKFITIKFNETVNRVGSIESKLSMELTEKPANFIMPTKQATINSATKAAYSLYTVHQPIEFIKKSLASVYGKAITDQVIEKLASDKEAQMLGLTYIDSNLYATPSELKEAVSMLNRRACNMIFQIKEGPLCKSASDICQITGLNIVKNAAADTKQQALKVVSQARKVGFDVNSLMSKLRDKDNTLTIKSFLNASISNRMGVNKTTKRMSSEAVSEIVEIATKHSNGKIDFKKVAAVHWSNPSSLVNVLKKNIINKTAFVNEVNPVINKNTDGISNFLNSPNFFNTDIYQPHQEDTDIAFGKTI